MDTSNWPHDQGPPQPAAGIIGGAIADIRIFCQLLELSVPRVTSLEPVLYSLYYFGLAFCGVQAFLCLVRRERWQNLADPERYSQIIAASFFATTVVASLLILVATGFTSGSLLAVLASVVWWYIELKWRYSWSNYKLGYLLQIGIWLYILLPLVAIAALPSLRQRVDNGVVLMNMRLGGHSDMISPWWLKNMAQEVAAELFGYPTYRRIAQPEALRNFVRYYQGQWLIEQ
ncbi:hypothetical protein GGR54DRAFT_201486 [Hypoxylon sp. NC1633]|nr:hypothetical protein GGR54DRAFT_201486 [Hypoxylon sp. NC1633]